MGVSDYKEAIGSSATICTILQLLVPIFMCRKYIVYGTTGESSSLTFVVGFLTSSLWLKYGLLQQEPAIIIVNMVGSVLQISYIGVFYAYTRRRKVVLQQLAVAVSIQLLTMLYIMLEHDHEVAVKRMGTLCCAVTIAFFAAPLAQLAHIIQTKSSTSLPFPLTMATFSSSCLWLVYGVIINDYNVIVPNIIGTSLTAIQLSLFVIYPAPPKPQAESQAQKAVLRSD